MQASVLSVVEDKGLFGPDHKAGGLQSWDLEQGSEEALVLWGRVGLGRTAFNCSLCLRCAWQGHYLPRSGPWSVKKPLRPPRLGCCCLWKGMWSLLGN